MLPRPKRPSFSKIPISLKTSCEFCSRFLLTSEPDKSSGAGFLELLGLVATVRHVEMVPRFKEIYEHDESDANRRARRRL